MKIKEFIIIPSSIDPMGLVHKPGKGPNNRFGFKNVGNNKANEFEETKEAPPGTYFTKTGNLVKGRLTKAAKQKGARETDPKDKGKPKTIREEWEEFKENFADKKVKGKSRPGRVKRAGASCKGSVSSLRAKAKKYGGERGKMYHWCANMKSGRKKK